MLTGEAESLVRPGTITIRGAESSLEIPVGTCEEPPATVSQILHLIHLDLMVEHAEDNLPSQLLALFPHLIQNFIKPIIDQLH